MDKTALSPAEIQRWTRIGVLAALAMLLGYMEAFLPIPIPGVKLGLANIAVLVALADHDIGGALCISLIKVVVLGLLFGSPLTLAYSAAGTLLAFCGMVTLSLLPTMHLVMVSVVGALLHEIGQLFVAQALLGTTTVWYLAPLLLLLGCVTGAICGVLASKLNDSLARTDAAAAVTTVNVSELAAQPARKSTIWLLVGLVAFVVAVFRVENMRILLAFTVLGLVLCALARVRAKRLLRSMAPLLALIAFTLAVQLVVSPQTAWEFTARSSLRLLSIAAACAAFMARVPTSDLTVLVARMATPLKRLGIQGDGFVLALDVALRLVPTMEGLIEPQELRLRDVPQLIPRAYERLLARVSKQ